MALKDLVFADIPVGKETVCGPGVHPVLERRGQRFPRSLAESLEPPVQSGVTQITPGGLPVRVMTYLSATARTFCKR